MSTEPHQYNQLQDIGTALRGAIPPQLDYVLIVYPRERITPDRVAYTMSATAQGTTPQQITEAKRQALDQAVEAVGCFTLKAKSAVNRRES